MKPTPNTRIALLIVAAALLATAGCVRTKGPGSTKDALSFAKRRLANLRSTHIISTPTGQFIGERLELRNEDAGFDVSGRTVEAWVKYDSRTHRTASLLTKEEAASAQALPVDVEWTENFERYEFKNGEWTLKVEELD